MKEVWKKNKLGRYKKVFVVQQFTPKKTLSENEWKTGKSTENFLGEKSCKKFEKRKKKMLAADGYK